MISKQQHTPQPNGSSSRASFSWRQLVPFIIAVNNFRRWMSLLSEWALAHTETTHRGVCCFRFSFLSRKVLSRTLISLLLFLAASTLSPHRTQHFESITQFSHQNKSVFFISYVLWISFMPSQRFWLYQFFFYFSMLGNAGKYLRIFTKQTAVISFVLFSLSASAEQRQRRRPLDTVYSSIERRGPVQISRILNSAAFTRFGR